MKNSVVEKERREPRDLRKIYSWTYIEIRCEADKLKLFVDIQRKPIYGRPRTD